MYVPGREVSVGNVPYVITSIVRTEFRSSLVADMGEARGRRKVSLGGGPYFTISRSVVGVP